MFSQRDTDLIEGYLKSCAMYTSPLVIQKLCAMYTLEREYFTIKKYNSNNKSIIVSENKKKVTTNTTINTKKHHVYGFTQINLYKTDTIFEWIFKIKTQIPFAQSTAFIGIGSYDKYTFKGYGGSGTKLFAEQSEMDIDVSVCHEQNGYKHNDIVQMICNTNTKQLIFKINNSNTAIKINAINFENNMKYYMCVRFYMYDEIQLISFKATII